MRFSHIELTNFRSFGEGTVRIDFPEDENLLALVGANNAGKSNLLAALRLVLSRRRYEPEAADFHRLDVTGELSIKLHLREHLLRETIFHARFAMRGRSNPWAARDPITRQADPPL
jgi:predicted ATP-dependent endonuclease of OLD family